MQIGVATVEICMKIQNEQTPTNKYIRYPTHTIPWCTPLPSYPRDSCWAMFTDALPSQELGDGNGLKRASTDERTMKMFFIDTMEYHSAVKKKNEISKSAW